MSSGSDWSFPIGEIVSGTSYFLGMLLVAALAAGFSFSLLPFLLSSLLVGGFFFSKLLLAPLSLPPTQFPILSISTNIKSIKMGQGLAIFDRYLLMFTFPRGI